MPISAPQSAAAMEVVTAILSETGPRGKRQLASMFLELVDRVYWPEYYNVIPEPRCLNNIKTGLEKGRYKDPLDVYKDLSLVFWNAIFYNEPASQISQDARSLKTLLETEWKKRTVLPVPRTSPPPSSPQKVHKESLAPETTSTLVVKEMTVAASQASTSAAPAPATAHVPQAIAVPPPVVNASKPSHSRPVSIRPKASHPITDNDESEMTSEPEVSGDALSVARDEESEEIIKQLEKGLPRWPGFSEEAWFEGANSDRIFDVIQAIKTYKDVSGNRLSTALEAVPEEATMMPYLSYTSALSFKLIEARARHKTYKTSKEFDLDMARLFEKSRRWHKPGGESYGHTLVLQRMYQALMSSDPPPGPPYHTTTNFAAIRSGPGIVKPVHGGPEENGTPGVTTHRVLTKDRTFVDELYYKGWSLKLADWVHLSSPDDSSRPIIGQIFRCWISDEPSKKGQPGITVSWYYRPEQTFHSANRMFWEGEVFKTSHFVDHPLEDVIEKIACQFTARHIRGRPRPPFWYLGFPLYVCDSRYNDRERTFVKIKNWNSCVPEEVRKSAGFMPIYPFERTVFPPRIPSPFLSRGGQKSSKGPGGLLPGDATNSPQPSGERQGTPVVVNGQKGVKTTRQSGISNVANKPPAGTGVASSSLSATTIPTQGIYQATNTSYQTQQAKTTRPDRSVITAVGGISALDQGVEKLPTETAQHFDRDPQMNQVLWFPAPPVNMARPTKPKYSITYLHFLATKRKGESDEDATMVCDDNHTMVKKSRVDTRPTVTDSLRAVLE